MNAPNKMTRSGLSRSHATTAIDARGPDDAGTASPTVHLNLIKEGSPFARSIRPQNVDPHAIDQRAWVAAFGDFVSVTAQELPQQVAVDLADSTNAAIGAATQEAAKTGKVEAQSSAMEKVVTKVWGGVDRFIRSQIDQSMSKARTAIDNRVAANLVVLTWVPLWAILAVFAMGHMWFPIGMLTHIPGVTLPWAKLNKLKDFKPGMPQPAARARARDVIGAYTTPAEQTPKELPERGGTTGNDRKGAVQEGQWREGPPDPPRRPGERGRMY